MIGRRGLHWLVMLAWRSLYNRNPSPFYSFSAFNKKRAEFDGQLPKSEGFYGIRAMQELSLRVAPYLPSET